MSWSLAQLGPYVSQGLGIPHDRLLQSFRPAVDHDLPGILDLRRAVFGGGLWWDDEGYVRWRYFNDELTVGQRPFWVFEKDQRIIGGLGLEPVTLVVDGEALEATRTLDIMVRPEVEGRGLGALMNMVIFEHYPITLVTGSNARSHKLISRMFQQALELRVWKALVRSRDFVERHVRVGALATPIAAAGDLLLALERTLRRVPRPNGLELRELSELDGQVTALGEPYERQGRILVRRSPQYLNWRFAHNPRCRYRMLGGFVGGRLAGYVVTRLNLARPNPGREGDIVDWLGRPPAGSAVSPLPFLLRAAVQQLVRDGAGVVRCMAFGTDVAALMRTTGLRLRPEERLPFFVRASDQALHKRLASGGDWFLTSADFDVE